ncbi:cation:proton antiporter [Stutzerimonas stutzeri]|uniref:cation:proton antiporter domain-containing protein n=1 Tax=Stutzerimonas stutzeri TaxID=316 RepID=UPI00210D4E0B|nr:cation:proton antiporter [Stutzerimonas stutzeri]MCQ4318865.1 cation:proton antiporter [Stutzerimonas stutzeri]
MSQLNIALAIMGGVAVCIALLSALIKRSPVSEPALAVLVGLAVGPYGLSWLDLARWGDTFSVLEQAARLTLAIGLMGVALRLQRAALKAMLKPVMLLLIFVMLGMWLVSSLLAGWLLGLSLSMDSPAAGCSGHAHRPGSRQLDRDRQVRETAPPLAAARHRCRRNPEPTTAWPTPSSCCQFSCSAIHLFRPGRAGSSSRYWILIGIGGAALMGAIVGFAAAKLLALSEHKKLVASSSLLGYTVASIMMHGVSAAPLSRLYAHHAGAAPRGSAHLDE